MHFFDLLILNPKHFLQFLTYSAVTAAAAFTLRSLSRLPCTSDQPHLHRISDGCRSAISAIKTLFYSTPVSLWGPTPEILAPAGFMLCDFKHCGVFLTSP